MMELIRDVLAELQQRFEPARYEMGFATMKDAASHAHVYIIPRYDGGLSTTRPVKAERAEPLTDGTGGRHLLTFVRPLLTRCRDVSVLAAFVRMSGLRLIEDQLIDLLARGGRLRLLTGDYLNITEPDALQRLLDLQARLGALGGGEGEDDDDAVPGDEALSGQVEVRLIETRQGAYKGRSFHPKAWLFERVAGQGDADSKGVAYVGSSNLTRSALNGGVEWNLRLEQRRDPAAFTRVQEAFEHLWESARELNQEWLDAYRAHVEAQAASQQLMELVEAEDEHQPPPEPPRPRDVQVEALAALERSRGQGRDKALVVMATGLGKTFLAAFDVRAFEQERVPGGERARVLFIAHRREILAQAANTFRSVFPARRFGWFAGQRSELSADVVFASVQKLSRRSRLSSLAPDAFDYIIVDEVHHAAARSYRRILQRVQPRFLLGLTATPERADGVDVLRLFDHHLAYRADLGVGIERELLVPFEYQGLRDTVDYAPIPWRGRRFEPQELATRVQTRERMETLWSALRQHPGERSLMFCVSIAHARFVESWLQGRGMKVAAVHSGPGSVDRAEALALLERGELDALCSVDLFNEGLDVRTIDRVVMLRPTESPVLFLQQLGRGLRIAPGKSRLQVIDFVGNHRVFLERLRVLVSLSSDPLQSLRALVHSRDGDGHIVGLPPGCSVHIELEAIDMLREFLPDEGDNACVRAYRELRSLRGVRPWPAELVGMGLHPGSVRRRQREGWFGFVQDEGDLDEVEHRAWILGRGWLTDVESVPSALSASMYLLEVLIEEGGLFEGLPLGTLQARCRAHLSRCEPTLLEQMEGEQGWRDTLLAYWTAPPSHGRSPWFVEEDGWLVARLPLAEGDDALMDALEQMTLELVDMKLAQRRGRRVLSDEGVSGFTMRVNHNRRHPILMFTDQAQRARYPRGETNVRLSPNEVWTFRFVQIACNVARPLHQRENRLGELLRGWFGPDAGQPGAEHFVRFRLTPDGWWVEPVATMTSSQSFDTPPPVPPATLATAERLQALFDLDEAPSPGFNRLGGRILILVEVQDRLVAPDRLKWPGEGVATGDQADIWTRHEPDGRWRYAGQGQWDDELGCWVHPEVDIATWRGLGKGRGASRRLEPEWEEAGRRCAQELGERRGAWFGEGRRRCRVVGVTSRGSVRIDGGDDGFKARSVSALDLGWVLKAREQARQSGSERVDEAFVNRLRYLDGTPKASTRWIDTGWALRLTRELGDDRVI